MARLGAIQTDLNKAIEGVWVNYELDIRLKIARLGNQNYQKYVQQLSRPHLQRMRGKAPNTDLIKEITKQAVSHCILLGWEHIQDDKGKDIPYSPEKALELLSDPRFEDLYMFILEIAQDAELYRQEIQKDSEKN